MSILSVSLPPEIESFIAAEMKSGNFESKGQLVKQALRKFEEELIVQRILRASQEVKEGKALSGDLRKLIKQIK